MKSIRECKLIFIKFRNDVIDKKILATRQIFLLKQKNRNWNNYWNNYQLLLLELDNKNLEIFIVLDCVQSPII